MKKLFRHSKIMFIEGQGMEETWSFWNFYIVHTHNFHTKATYSFPEKAHIWRFCNNFVPFEFQISYGYAPREGL